MTTFVKLPDTLSEAIDTVANRVPERIAMQIKQERGYRQCTYRQMIEVIDKIAAALTRHDLCHGHRVAIVSENRPEWMIAYFGIVAAGGIVVPLDIQLNSGDLARLLARSGSRLAFVSTTTWPLLRDAGLPVIPVSFDPVHDPNCQDLDGWVETGRSGNIENPRISPDDVAAILYTSGTTAEPKGVCLTHRNLMSNVQALARSGLGKTEDQFLAILPLHHAYPFMATGLIPLLLGAEVTFLPTLQGPLLTQCLKEAKVTVLVGVPQVFAMVHRGIVEGINRRPPVVRWCFHLLLGFSGALRRKTGLNCGRFLFASVHKQFGSSLRLLVSGGAKLDLDVAQFLFCLGFTLLEGYGLTETAPIVTLTPSTKQKPGSVGLPIAGVQVRIVNPDATGIGEVTVAGANVMKGYDADPVTTAQSIRNGWFYTGDLGCLDQEGYLFLTGRAKELIVTAGGKNIVPEELEALYSRSPAVGEICIVGVASLGGEGEGLHAVVVPNFDYVKSLKVVDVRQLIKTELTKISVTLPPYKRIRGLTIVTTPLPHTRLEKLQRHLVAAMVDTAGKKLKAPQSLSVADQAFMETETARRIVSLLKPFVHVKRSIVPHDHLELDLEFDSLRRVELVSALEASFGRLPEARIHEVMTVRELIEQVSAAMYDNKPSGEGVQSWADILKAEPPGDLRAMLLASTPWAHHLLDSVGRTVLRLVFRVGFRLCVTGIKHLAIQGPCVLVANHTSVLDPFVIMAAAPSPLSRRLYTIGWQAFFHGGFLHWFARVGRVIPVGMEASLVTALRAAALVLRQGRHLLIFPEGQRSVDGSLDDFRPGIGILACELGVPVVPIWIEGTFQVMPIGSRWPRPHPIAITAGKPVVVTQEMMGQWRSQGRDCYQEATRAVREAVMVLNPRVATTQLNGKGLMP